MPRRWSRRSSKRSSGNRPTARRKRIQSPLNQDVNTCPAASFGGQPCPVRGRGSFEVRKLGIIGGTSWSSTALYYEHINRLIAQRLGGLHSARLAIESIDFAELIALENADDWDGIAEMYVDAAK